MVHHRLKEEILDILKKRGVCSREEIARELKTKPNRAILMGYLRCLVDLEIIESKNAGKAKIYFLKKLKGCEGK
jgi:predicted transcriptional regulator